MTRTYKQQAFLSINPMNWGATYESVEDIVRIHGAQKGATTVVHVRTEDTGGSDEFDSVALPSENQATSLPHTWLFH